MNPNLVHPEEICRFLEILQPTTYIQSISYAESDRMSDDANGFHVVTLDDTTPEGRKAIEIFEYSIPEEERIDMDLLRSILPECYELVEWCLMDADRVVGYCALIKTPKAIFGLFLAIDSELRGKGYGTKTLKMMFGDPDAGFPTFFGVETPDDAASNNQQRLARIRLYERFGFSMSDIRMRNRFNGAVVSIMWNAKTEEEKSALFDIVMDMMVKGGAYETI